MPKALTITSYTYDELSKEAKAAVKQDFYDWFHEWHWEGVEDWLKNDVKDHYGLGELELLYSFGFCQGDGVGLKGQVELTSIQSNDDDFKPLLALLGAHRVRRTVGKHQVEWPCPVRDLLLLFHNERNSPFFCEGQFNIVLQLPAGVEDDDQWDEGEVWLSKENHTAAPEIWDAVAGYFDKLCTKLYRSTSDDLLDMDESAWESFIDCHDFLRFNEDGDRIDNLGGE